MRSTTSLRDTREDVDQRLAGVGAPAAGAAARSVCASAWSPRPAGRGRAGRSAATASSLHVERVDEVEPAVRRAHPVVDLDEQPSGASAPRSDARGGDDVEQRRCAAPRRSARCAPPRVSRPRSRSSFTANTWSWTPQPKSGRITRSPRRGAQDRPDRLADARVVADHGDPPVPSVDPDRERPPAAEEPAVTAHGPASSDHHGADRDDACPAGRSAGRCRSVPGPRCGRRACC